MRNGELGQELFNAASGIGAELLGARYAAVESDDTFRVSLLNPAFNGDLVRDPSGTNKVALHQRDAML